MTTDLIQVPPDEHIVHVGGKVSPAAHPGRTARNVPVPVGNRLALTGCEVRAHPLCRTHHLLRGDIAGPQWVKVLDEVLGADTTLDGIVLELGHGGGKVSFLHVDLATLVSGASRHQCVGVEVSTCVGGSGRGIRGVELDAVVRWQAALKRAPWGCKPGLGAGLRPCNCGSRWEKENVTEGGSSSGGGLGSPQCMVAVGFHGYKDGRMVQQGGWRL